MPTTLLPAQLFKYLLELVDYGIWGELNSRRLVQELVEHAGGCTGRERSAAGDFETEGRSVIICLTRHREWNGGLRMGACVWLR